MIANELNRASKLLVPENLSRFGTSLKRMLRLVDLTIETRPRRALCRELLRWRDLVATLYISEGIPLRKYQDVFYAFLRLIPTTSQQIPNLLPNYSTRDA